MVRTFVGMHPRRGPALAVALPAAGVLLIASAVQAGAVGAAERWLFGASPSPVSLGVAPSSQAGSDAPSPLPGPASLDPGSPSGMASLEGSVDIRPAPPSAVRRTTAPTIARRHTAAATERARTTTSTSRTTRPATTSTRTGTPTTKPPTTKPPTTEPTTPTRTTAPAPEPGGSGQAAEVVRLTNAQRAANGCPALTVDSRLTRAAQAHSEDMRERGYFEHDNPDGQSSFDRMKAAGYSFRMAAENIAAGQPTPAAVVDAWMNSAGHRKNILNCGLTQIGVGVASGGSYRIYWTQDFGTPS